jgi:hypothetical protein
MRILSIVMLILAGSAINMSVVSAQKANTCKECRDFRRACLTAHSQAACKTDYDICMKHCRTK